MSLIQSFSNIHRGDYIAIHAESVSFTATNTANLSANRYFTWAGSNCVVLQSIRCLNADVSTKTIGLYVIDQDGVAYSNPGNSDGYQTVPPSQSACWTGNLVIPPGWGAGCVVFEPNSGALFNWQYIAYRQQ